MGYFHNLSGVQVEISASSSYSVYEVKCTCKSARKSFLVSDAQSVIATESNQSGSTELKIHGLLFQSFHGPQAKQGLGANFGHQRSKQVSKGQSVFGFVLPLLWKGDFVVSIDIKGSYLGNLDDLLLRDRSFLCLRQSVPVAMLALEWLGCVSQPGEVNSGASTEFFE